MIALTQQWVTTRMRLTLRNPRALVFTFAFPLILIVLFSALNGNAEVDAYGEKIRFAQFYTPAIAIFSLVAACYTSLILGISTARDQGLFKRVRATPLPMGIYLGSWVTGAMLTGIGAVVLLFVVSVPAFGVDIYARTLPAALLTLVLGAACLSSLGVAVSSLVKNAEQAMPVAQLTFLPISFISGIWFPLDGAPDWLVKVSHFFPLSHIVNAFGSCFVPGTSGSQLHGSDLLAIAIWTAVGLFVAVRRFRFEP
ncbi:ABC transporter permease [Solirubrobacter phytolaccae]|uniref:Transport permease protein n=1 Tax=Solirubrobacter phytolaccae TaxID=1404360 RepID=A0A9X3NBS1_9ACTN|nr:ABC transporter permease [Solirubrobacter phytolaccae]MDA0183745.1 ABC transporter permease [Solirubrobacter phytolaccae]